MAPTSITDTNANAAEDGTANNTAAAEVAAANNDGDGENVSTVNDDGNDNKKEGDEVSIIKTDVENNSNDQTQNVTSSPPPPAAATTSAEDDQKLNPEQAKQVLNRYLQKKKKELEELSIIPKDVPRVAGANANASSKTGAAAAGDNADENEHGTMDEQDNEEEENANPEPTLAESSGCSCRKSTCILLYCPCFGDGKSCQDFCKCMNCKNPKGVNPSSKITLAEKKKRAKIEEKKKKQERRRLEALKGKPKPVKEFPSLLMLTVSPGRLGLTLSIVAEGGAQIVAIDPACTFRGQIHVGDRIVTIDGNKVTKLEDVAMGKERVRKFGIVKAPTAPRVPQPAGNPSAPRVPQPAGAGVARKKPIDIDAAVSVAASAAAAARSAPEVSATPAATTPRGPVVVGRRSIDELYPRDNKRKQTFPYLTELGAHSNTDRLAEHKREDLLTELLQWDKKNDINTIAKMGPSRYQVLTIPLKRRESVNKREFDNQCFHQYNKQTKVFDKFLNAWASYCDGTQEDAANMVLFYLAKRFPQCYVKNFEMATKKNEKINGPPPVELPPDFVSYDGTNDIKWNSRYAELVKYKEEHGDCKVYSKSDLGRWVCSQRSARNQKARNMSEQRIELLDSLGFLWSGVPEGWTKQIKGGCPRQNRAIAAKLVYPDLTIREVLYLGGFTEEELNVIKDQKHTWRTGYVYYKDVITKKVDNYETARRSGARIQIEKLVNILNGDDEDKYEQVFGENGHLLPTFLEAAEERRRNGIVEKPRSYKKRKRAQEEAVAEDAMLEEEEEEPASKQPHIEEEEQGANDMDFQAQVAYEQMNNNAQQVARDLHSWRHQSNYWR